jgi:hypothetical protein
VIGDFENGLYVETNVQTAQVAHPIGFLEPFVRTFRTIS